MRMLRLYNLTMFSFSFSLFRPKAPERRKQEPMTLPPDITPKQMLQVIVNDALRDHEIASSRPTRIIQSSTRSHSHSAMVMIDVPNWATLRENMRKAERTIETNAQAVLGVSALIYWRADLSELPAKGAASSHIRRELALLREKSRVGMQQAH